MGKVCVKCGYERKLGDSGHEYECPKCGVIYAKAEEALASRPRPQKVETKTASAEKPSSVQTDTTELNTQSTSVLDLIERKFLFALTRGVSVTLIALLVFSIIGGAISLGSKLRGEPTVVSSKEVLEAMRTAQTSATGATDTLDLQESKSDKLKLMGVNLPPHVKANFTSDANIRVLTGWLTDLDREMRQEFVNEMDEAIAAAEKAGLQSVDAINKFKEIKLQRLRDIRMAASVQDQKRIYYIFAAFSAVLLVSLLSLTLVLLAIERNTRKSLAN